MQKPLLCSVNLSRDGPKLVEELVRYTAILLLQCSARSG